MAKTFVPRAHRGSIETWSDGPSDFCESVDNGWMTEPAYTVSSPMSLKVQLSIKKATAILSLFCHLNKKASIKSLKKVV